MNLIIDIGNSRFKFYLFENQVLIKSVVAEKNFLKVLNETTEKVNIHQVMLSNVGNSQYDKIVKEKYSDKLTLLSKDLKFPFKNKYATPNTLGVDRLALVTSAVRQYPNQDVLVIDMGSCITYDYVNAKGEYLGGAISEGANMRFKSMHKFTANLPLFSLNSEKINPLGIDTKSCMQSGVIHGITYEIEGYISFFSEKLINLTVILTGGDAEYFDNTIKNPIFAKPNFLAEGLNYILEDNI